MIQKNENPYYTKIMDFLNIQARFPESTSEIHLKAIKKMEDDFRNSTYAIFKKEDYLNEHFLNAIFTLFSYLNLRSGPLFYIPDELVNITTKLIDPNSKVLNIFSGSGKFIVNFKKAVGIEPYLMAVEISKLVNHIKQNRNTIYPYFPIGFKIKTKFDTVISLPPFGNQEIDRNILEESLSHLKENGKMFIFVPEGFLFKSSLNLVRDKVLLNNRLKAVISLPDNTFSPVTGIKTSLIIIEKGAQGKTYFAKSKNLSDLGVIAEDYLKYEKQEKFTIGFDAKVVNRWDYLFNEPIDFEVEGIDFEYSKVLLKDICSLAIGKSDGAKIAINKTGSKVVWQDDFETLIKENNIFLVPKLKINPYFLFLFLTSSLGQKTLKKFIKGDSVPYISIGDLENYPVIFPNLQKQTEIVENTITITNNLVKFETLAMSGRELIKNRLFNLKDEVSKYEMPSSNSEKEYYKKFPFPIAIAYRKFLNANSNTSKFILMIELYEIVIKFMTLVNLADFIGRMNSTDESLMERIPMIKNLSHATGGVWAEIFISLTRLKQGPDSKPFLEEIQNFNLEKYSKKIIEFVEIRNSSLRGHGATLPDEVYAIKIQEIFPNLEELIKSLSFLSKYKLVKTNRLEKNGDVYRIHITNLMGDNSSFDTDIIESRTPIDTDTVILFNQNMEYLKLEPYIIYEICPECLRSEVLLFNKYDNKKISYYGEETGHTPSYNYLNKLPSVLLKLVER